MFRNTTNTAVLLAGLAGLMVAIGSLFGRGGAVVGLGLGLAMVGFSYWKRDALAIHAAGAVPADESNVPEYFAIMRDLTTRAHRPMPRLYVSPEPQPNAFASGRNPAKATVGSTQGLMVACTWDEVRGVLARELAHVRNRDILIGYVAAAVATGITIVANMAMWGAMLGAGAATTRTISTPWCCSSSRCWHRSRRRYCRWRCSAAASSKPTGRAPNCSAPVKPWPRPWTSSRPLPTGSR